MTAEDTPGTGDGATRAAMEISSGSGEGVIYWELDPPVELSGSVDQQIQGLRDGLQMTLCNDDLAAIMGFDSRADLLAQSGVEILSTIGVQDKLGELVDSGYRLEEFRLTLPGAAGSERVYRVNTHCVIQGGMLSAIWNSLRDDTEQLNRNRDLRVSQQLLSDSLSMTGIGTWSSNFHGSFDLQSPQVAVHFGLPPGQDYSFSEVIERVHPADRDKLIKGREEAMRSDEVQSVEFRVIHDNGSVHHLRATSRSAFDDAGQPLRWIGSIQDITQYKLQSEARESQYLYLPDPLFALALDEPVPTGLDAREQLQGISRHARLVDCNYALARVTGRERNEIIDARPDFLNRVWDEFGLKFCRQGHQLEDERFRVDADGEATPLWFEINLTGTVEHGRLTRIWAYCRDVTEQVEVQMGLEDIVRARTEALHKEVQLRRQNNEKLRQQAILVSHMSEAVIVTDPGRRIGEWNNGAERMFGFTRSEAEGKVLDELLSLGSKLPNADQGDSDAVLQSMDGWRGELECMSRDGSRVICESSMTVLRDTQNQPLSLIHVMRDVGERKRYEAELAATKVAAERANLAKTRFIRGLSHEMRTPLNAILGFEQLLERLPEQPLSHRQQNYLRQIRSGGEHLLELVNEVLDLARIEAGEIGMVLEILDLGRVIEECLQLLRPQAEERKVTISGNYQNGGQIFADPRRLKQILFNLMSNGVKYNSTPGTLDVSIDTLAGSRLRISVSDTGEGIPEESLAGLYEPFNRLGVSDIDTHGTGLGLTITRELVAAMDGEMGVNSVPGEGSEFWIELPRVPDNDN